MQELTEGSLRERLPLTYQKKRSEKKPPQWRGGKTLDKPVCTFITRLQTQENVARPYDAYTKG